MQPITTLDITTVAFPSILLGILLGYFIGEMTSLRLIDRVGLALIASALSGIIISLLLNSIIPITAFEVLLSSISVLGGLIIGLSYNWTPPPESSRRSHIIYEPYDDEDFEREIEESLRGEI
jgi:hypothetical protein